MSEKEIYPAVLESFYIYNPTLGESERTEHEKIIFFYPSDTSADEKQTLVGLSEGLVNFTVPFGSACDSLHSLHRRHVLFECESDFWMVFIVRNPHRIVTKDGEPKCVYLSEDLSDEVLQSILRQIYRTFEFFNGSFHSIVEKFSVKTLRHKLEEMLPVYIQSIDFSSLEIFDVLDGIHYLPLDRNLYLKTQAFVHQLENRFSNIRSSMLLYYDHLAWSGLTREESRLVYRYHVQHISKRLNEDGIQRSRFGSDVDCYLVGLDHAEDTETDTINVPHAFLSVAKRGEGPSEKDEVCMVVYQLGAATIFVFISVHTANNLKFYKQLREYVRIDLPKLTSTVGDYFQRCLRHSAMTSENEYRYIYFNDMNLALKTSIKHRGSLPSEVVVQLTRMREQLRKGLLEQIVFCRGGFWLVGRKGGDREYYVILEETSSLTVVEDEVRALSKQLFSSVFFPME